MNDELRAIIFEHVINKVEGGTSEDIFQMIDEAIEEGYLDTEDYRKYESEIHALIDNHVFTCVTCGWTVPVSEGGQDTEGGELQCRDCSGEPE